MASGLGCGGCPTYVNASNRLAVDTLKRLQLEWSASRCGLNIDCMAMACLAPQGAGCKADSTGSGTGTCVDYRAD
jgi:hypothetical protein